MTRRDRLVRLIVHKLKLAVRERGADPRQLSKEVLLAAGERVCTALQVAHRRFGGQDMERALRQEIADDEEGAILAAIIECIAAEIIAEIPPPPR